MINLLVKGNEKTPFWGGLSAFLLFLYLADMQSLINFCGLNERGVCICRCYAIPSFHLFRNGPVSYVKIEWKVTKPTVSVRNKFTSTRLFKIISNNVYKSVKFKKVVHVLHDVQYNYVFHNINNINLHVEINGYIKVMYVCHLY